MPTYLFLLRCLLMCRPRRSGGGGGLQPLQLKLQQHIDREDRRIKELTESILYEFVPAALRIAAPEAVNAVPGVEMAPEQCRVRQTHSMWPVAML